MSAVKQYYAMENEEVKARAHFMVGEIGQILADTARIESSGRMGAFGDFVSHTGHFLLDLLECENGLEPAHFEKSDLETLKRENERFYSDIYPKNYGSSYANPSYCVAKMGRDFGQALSFFHSRVRKSIRHAFEHKLFRIVEVCEIYLRVCELIRTGAVEYDALLETVVKEVRYPNTRDLVHDLQENFCENQFYLADVVRESDWSDLRYLFRYGRFISANELKNARFIAQYPDLKIRELSARIVDCYVEGFRKDNKDMSRKSTVRIFYPVGYERLVREIISDMLDAGLKTTIGGVSSTQLNRQYSHDHKFDAALYIDNAYVNRAIDCVLEAYQSVRGPISACSGSVLIENFGEEPFVPITKKEALRFSELHQRLMHEYEDRRSRIVESYMPRRETSFTIISFPSPEIGASFEEIFDSIYSVNMLDTKKYEGIQQKIIDELDKAEYVHIKGRGNCETDIKVRMHNLSDPSRETNFVNCGADVNIPLGEVFTSPVLEGTNGVLHIEETFLDGLRYDNLKLHFRDGYVAGYSCSNYPEERDNAKYIEENLLFPHKTLPIGEFAIGTNTLAYAISKKYDILRILPILIIEKMGPHFAIGDTCFRNEEDLPSYNELDGKEVVARENERTSLRKEKPEEAYTYCHTDITIPYESIASISAIKEDGSEIEIIRNGVFVLEGTEELNVPLKQAVPGIASSADGTLKSI